jgi:DNA replication ATP-dependent helicase Dna2
VALKKQYRMNAKIMALSNKLVYNGELELANPRIKDKTVRLCDSWQTLVSPAFTDILSPQEPVVFLNYDPIINAISKKYAHQEPLIRKVIETELTAYVYRSFAALDLPRNCISIISAYNTSVNRMVELLRQKGVSCDGHSSVLTIDKSQGIDKEVIILLIEKGNDELIENPRRLNVALTRAKSKLIIIGSESYLSNMRVW